MATKTTKVVTTTTTTTETNTSETTTTETTTTVTETTTVVTESETTTGEETTTTTTTTAVVTTEAPTTTSEPSTAEEDILWGDANCDKQVNLADAVLIMQSIANPDKYQLTKEGERNGDVDEPGSGITNKDAMKIQKYKLNLIDSLAPEK